RTRAKAHRAHGGAARVAAALGRSRLTNCRCVRGRRAATRPTSVSWLARRVGRDDQTTEGARMADLNERDAKLVQYLSEAYGKEKELETSLEAHIGMTTKVPYKKRLKAHLKETKAHAKALERRIKKLGGGG